MASSSSKASGPHASADETASLEEEVRIAELKARRAEAKVRQLEAEARIHEIREKTPQRVR
jgi:predicted Ser/Thr protein kinase